MALFGKKKSEEKNEEAVVKTEVKATPKAKKAKAEASKKGPKKRKNVTVHFVTKSKYSEDVTPVLARPRITEKATFAAEGGTYVFEVAVNATKRDVARAIEHYYKVKPVKVNVVKIPRKKRQSRRRRSFGLTAEGKKAYVYLKKGDTIDIT